MRISDRVSLRSPHPLPEPPRTTSSPSDLHHAGNLFRRNFPATSFPGNGPHILKRRRLIYTPVETPPATGISRAPTRRSFPPDCHPRAGAWLTFRPLPTRLQARLAPSWPSSPPAVLPEPCISILSLFLASLPLRPPPTGLPLHLRGLGAAPLPLQARQRPFFSIDCTSHSRGFTVFLSPPKSEPILGLSSIQILRIISPGLPLSNFGLWVKGYEDHLVTQEADIPEVDRVQWRKIDAQPKDYTRMISSVFIRWLLLLSISANRTWIYLLILLDKFFMVLTLIGLRPDLEPIRDQILGSSSVPSLDDVFARLLLVPEVEANVLIAPIAINLATLAIVAISYMEDLLALPIWPSPLILRCLSLRAPPHLRHLRLLLPLLPSLDLFSSITTTSDLPTVTLANGSQTVAKGIGLALPLPSLPLTSDRSTGKTIGIGRESQGLYHLTSDSSPAVCISTDAPLLIHNRLGHPSLSKFQKMVPRFFHFVVASVDNAREYFSAQFTSFMSHHGILHQSSCAHTPQQNGIAERKNRHLVETARTLLLHSHVPFRFWGDAVLTACYLINRMPSSVLHDQIPHSLLFPDQPLYFLPPRVFGYFRRVIVVIPLRLIGTLSPLMSPSLRTHHSFPPLLSLFPVSEVLPIPIVSPPDAMPPRPLQVYHRRPRVVAPLPFPEAPADSLPIPSASPAPALPSPNDLPIAVRKAPKKLFPIQAGDRPMVDEMTALHSNDTWDLVVLPSGKSTVGCRWVYAVKVGPDGQIASVRLLLSMAAMCSWPLYQLDIKNAFLHGDLAEEVYMEQPPGFVAQGESGLVCRLRRSLYGLKQSPRTWFNRFSSVVQEFGMLRSTADHSVFYHHNSLGQCIYLVVYVDDIVITGSDQDDIQKLKQHLFTHFQTKDLGKLKYFLGIEIAQSSSGVVLSQRKYALDILEETGMLDCKPIDTPMDPNVKLVPGQGEPLGDPGRYRRLVGKLNYLTITRPDISFPVSVVSQFLQSPCDSHWDAVIRILRYIKSTPGQGVLYENRGHTQVVGYTDADWAGSPIDRRSTSGYCVFIGGNLISWKSKKQDVVTRSSAEASIELWLWQHVNSYG
ncbi:Retrovirus-related Pol polyprotein from transposon TNT 1-94 [Vitis vinifera]|uniref:Retrovirus-related Pol polyprotein from transposon TNT 1-94 n=1 Tax=Vitis vinifera TaxID=29760 RepID=A0A438KN20_VITVI|nr:Retrovirus-related Pol polyprotein from transposon TNT 1-94 [Vitis vinifera]